MHAQELSCFVVFGLILSNVGISQTRDSKSMELTWTLPRDWRQAGDLFWRATTWSLRRMVTGGMVLREITADERAEQKLSGDVVALRVKHAGQYGPHAAAKKAGIRQGERLVRYDGRDDLLSETALLNFAINNRRVGDHVAATVQSDGKEIEMRRPIQP